jgi:long-chain acyl-CoA synthetase
MHTGLVSGERHLSHAQLQDQVLRAATGLSALGVGPGDCVALLLRNDFPFLATVYAANRLGAYAVPINWHFKAGEVRYILDDCGAKVLVAHADLLAGVAHDLSPGLAVITVETPPEITAAYGLAPGLAQPPATAQTWQSWLAAHAPATAPARTSPGSILYTSGTTGRPKGVRRNPPTPAQLDASARMAGEVYNVQPGVRSVVPGPLYHSAPLSYGTRVTPGAALQVLMPRFDPVELLELIQRERIEQMFAVPTMFVRLLKLPAEVRARYDVSSLKFVMHAAAPCPPEVKRAMIAWWGPVIWEFYGSTESLAVTICNSEEWLAHPGTVGRRVAGADIRIVGDDGQEVPQGAVGEIYAGFPDMADFTYQGKPEERAKIDLGGLITSGDVGYFDAHGFLHLCDRKRDMVISGGVNIYPAEIEAVLLAMPEVADGCVFGIPDAEYGEKLHAVVQPVPGSAPNAAAVRAFLARHLANYKVPTSIEFRAELPRQDSGKIFKRLLREPHWAGHEKRI